MTIFTKSDSKMKTDEKTLEQGSNGYTVRVLGVTVGLLVLCIVAMVAVGGWVVNNMADNYSNKEHFEISIDYGDVIKPESVSVDIEGQSEFIVIRDPETSLIENIMFLDYKNAVKVVYRSRTDDCVLVPIADDFMSFEEEHALVNRQNGTVVNAPPSTYYEVRGRVHDQEEIPQEMSNYCSTSNSYWAEKIEEGSRMKRDLWCCPCCSCMCDCFRCIIVITTPDETIIIF